MPISNTAESKSGDSGTNKSVVECQKSSGSIGGGSSTSVKH